MSKVGTKIKGFVWFYVVVGLIACLVIYSDGIIAYNEDKNYIKYATVNGGAYYSDLEEAGNNALNGLQRSNNARDLAIAILISALPAYGFGVLVDCAERRTLLLSQLLDEQKETNELLRMQQQEPVTPADTQMELCEEQTMMNTQLSQTENIKMENDQRIVYVDKSIDEIQCPICLKEQKANNDAFVALNDHKDSKEKAEQLLKEHRNENFLVGNVITFGSYEQDNNTANGKEEIEWVVLVKEDDRMLVITRYVFDKVPYHEQRENVTWENCTLRKWLNSTFLNRAFNSEEQAIISTVTVSGDKNSNATQDKIFLLSIEEVNKYFSSDSDRMGMNVHKKAYSWFWWLRSPGKYEQQRAAYILTGGAIDTTGTPVNSENIGVRPALWIDLNH